MIDIHMKTVKSDAIHCQRTNRFYDKHCLKVDSRYYQEAQHFSQIGAQLQVQILIRNAAGLINFLLSKTEKRMCLIVVSSTSTIVLDEFDSFQRNVKRRFTTTAKESNTVMNDEIVVQLLTNVPLVIVLKNKTVKIIQMI